MAGLCEARLRSMNYIYLSVKPIDLNCATAVINNNNSIGQLDILFPSPKKPPLNTKKPACVKSAPPPRVRSPETSADGEKKANKQ